MTQPIEVRDLDAEDNEPELDLDGNPVEPESNADGSEPGEYVAPTKEEFDKLQRDLKRANSQAVKYKKQVQDAATASGSEPNVDDAVKAATEEVESKYKARIVNAEATSELVKMGLKVDPKRFLKLLDLSEVEVEDEEIFGLDDQLAQIKADFPDAFDLRKTKGDKRTAADAADKVNPPEKKNDIDKLAAMLRG